VLRLLAGTVAPDSGHVRLDGTDVTAAPPAERVRRGLVRALQTHASFGELTVLQHALVSVNRTRRSGLTPRPDTGRLASRKREGRPSAALSSLPVASLSATHGPAAPKSSFQMPCEWVAA
jgi:ABC-type branched-subunit amino acid transport system ATPase component